MRPEAVRLWETLQNTSSIPRTTWNREVISSLGLGLLSYKSENIVWVHYSSHGGITLAVLKSGRAVHKITNDVPMGAFLPDTDCTVVIDGITEDGTRHMGAVNTWMNKNKCRKSVIVASFAASMLKVPYVGPSLP